MNNYHRLKTLLEAMDVTMEFQTTRISTQPESDLSVMETCYEEPVIEETYTTEEVQMRSQAHKKVKINKEVDPSSRNKSIWDKRTSKEIKIKTSLSTTREITNTMVTSPHTKDTSSLEQTRCLITS